MLHPTAAPTPAEFAGYLRQRNWEVRRSGDVWVEFSSKPADGDPFVVEVPQRAQATDYPRAARILIENLSRVEARPTTEILRDIKAVASDVVRIAIESHVTRDGRISVEAGHRVYEAARDMLLAAACSVGDPRPAFPRRKAAGAMDLIRRARFGQTEIGSFVLTIECDVPQRLRTDLIEDEDPEAPMERQTSVRLAEALAGVSAAAREAASSATVEPFERRIDEGVSANLCDAVAEILDATNAESVHASFSFASRRPVRSGVPREVYFSYDAMGQLREAANRLRDSATYPGLEIAGHIVKLHSADPAMGGTAVLHSEVDGRWRHVWVLLDPIDYQVAIAAHSDGSFVRCTGDVMKVGQSWNMLNPRGFKGVPER